MTGKQFFDTTILVYAYDESETEKRTQCKPLVEAIFQGKKQGVISLQVLGELFSVLTEKIDRPLPADMSAHIIQGFLTSPHWQKLHYSETTLLAALQTARLCHTPWWDTLLAETAKEGGIRTIITENIADFARIPGIRAVNPISGKR